MTIFVDEPGGKAAEIMQQTEVMLGCILMMLHPEPCARVGTMGKHSTCVAVVTCV
jgi:hypothetical protein